MSDFNPIKAVHEELTALNDIAKTLASRERAATLKISEAEEELNSVRKLLGYARIQIENARDRLRKLEQEH